MSSCEEDMVVTSDKNVEKEYQTEMVDLGRYEFNIKEVLGEGGFGYVFKGREKSTGEKVAIKQIPNEQVKQNEIMAMQKSTNNDCLVQLIGACTQKDCTFLIMELCDLDLNEHIETEGPLQPKDLRIVLDCLARGYEELHHQNVIHRDIKPQNILLKYNNAGTEIINAKITDFTLCREADEVMDNVAGSMLYMAPEVGACLLNNNQYDASIDMWSIGCVLYQCLTGECPFDESKLCKLFLWGACENFGAYQTPYLPEDRPKSVRILIFLLLQMDPKQRITAPEFFEIATEWTRNHQKPKRKWDIANDFWENAMWPGPAQITFS